MSKPLGHLCESFSIRCLFDRREVWAGYGLANAAQWLNWQCGIGEMVARAGFTVKRVWTDENSLFSVQYCERD